MLFGQPISLVWRTEQWKRKKFLPNDGPSPWGRVPMRQSFHHPALTSCGAPLPPGKKYVAVRYLTKEKIFFVVDVKGKGQEIFEDACKYLGLQDTELFGLAFIHDDEYIFIDPSLKISKYAVRSWKTSDFGISGDGQPLLVLYLRVKHYVDCHLLVSEKVARHHYYLQLRENVKNYSQPISEEKSFVLAALALQADLGNYSEQRHKGKYFEISSYFPSWIVLKIGEDYIVRNVPALHKDNVGLSRGEAQVGYIKEASDKTAPHNLHLYKMQRKKGKSWTAVWLGISDTGLHIYEQLESEKTKSLLSTFLWCDIAKLHFEKKKFEILSEGSPEYRTFTYYVKNEELAKNLLWVSQSTHHFHMSNEIRVQDLKKLELDGGKFYRESYIYTDQSDLARHEKMNFSASKKSIRSLAADVNGETVNGLDESKMFLPSEKKPIHNPACNIHRINSDVGHCSVAALKNRSMETLPLSNGCMLSPELKYKSRSIACFPDRFLTPCPGFMQGTATHLWNSNSNNMSVTPTSTLLSQRSCASCTDSACSSLSLASGSNIKASTLNASSKKQMNDSSRWIKCDSFEELAINCSATDSKSLPHKVCISTFRDSHVRTASFYDAVGLSPKKNSCNSSGKVVPCPVSSASHASPKVSLQGQSVGQMYQKSTVKPATTHSSSVTTSNKVVPGKNVMGVHFRHQHAGRHSDAPTSRTATRIGISSLSRDQKLPLTLFSGRGKMMACGSEPNLYNSLFDSDKKLKDFSALQDSVQNQMACMRKPNSRSEMCLSVIGQSVEMSSKSALQIVNAEHVDNCSNDQVLPTGGCEGNMADDENAEFPFIPPPPAYRNVSDEANLTNSVVMSPEEKLNVKHISQNITDTSHRELRGCLSSPPDVLDIQQLRQKSQDLDLPLISALCNDRSLLMLPKTVPTCSRQRHLGNKDPLRFARGYSTTPSNGTIADLIVPMSRPATWHVESSNSPLWCGDAPVNSLWCDRQVGIDGKSSVESDSSKQNLPPTILTSFGKAPDKCNSLSESSYQSSDYRLNKLQMIPTKLLSGIVPNGKIHLKGSSS